MDDFILLLLRFVTGVVLLAIALPLGIWLALRLWKSNAVQLRRLLFIVLLVYGFALIDGSLGFYVLHRLLTGRPWPKPPAMVLGFSERILGLGAISLCVFRYYRRESLRDFIIIYVAIGFSAGLALFSAHGVAWTLYMILQRKPFLFNDTLGHALALSGFGAVICTSVGLIRRAVWAYRGRPEVKPDRPGLAGCSG
jgi:hypothetical protein